MTYRNSRLLRMAEGQACVACGRQDGTIVAAHSNLGEHGKGMSVKAHDGMTAWLCYRCHTRLDQGADMTKEQRREFTLTAICRTYMQLWEQGLIGVTK